MSTGVKEVVKTGRQRPYALSIFFPMVSSPGGPGGGGVAGSVHPGRRASFVVPVAGPVGPKLVWSEAVACGEKAEGGDAGSRRSRPKMGGTCNEFQNDEASCRQRASCDELSS